MASTTAPAPPSSTVSPRGAGSGSWSRAVARSPTAAATSPASAAASAARPAARAAAAPSSALPTPRQRAAASSSAPSAAAPAAATPAARPSESVSGGERPVGRLDGAEHVAVAPRLLGHERVRHSVRVPLDPHDLRDHDRAACCAVIEIPLCRMPTMLADVSAGEYVSVHARTGYLAHSRAGSARPGLGSWTQPGRAAVTGLPRPARMPSQLRTTARQASVVARPSIGLTVWRCQRSSAA